ncbi:DUF3857 domain-containing transglutaminase family protein [Chitinophaga defluvii]|uniref:DUF3857 domain-containing protein n=1 Tax=Chitinophaga defluvii TaxID=3163343 RepID=A0ABV2T4M1_9BACT
MGIIKIGGLLLAIWMTHPVFAKDPEYPVAAIPAALKENAHAVKRWEEVTLKVISPGETRYTNHYVITILDEQGAEHATFAEGYDMLKEVRSIRGALYDAAGRQIKKLKNSDIQDVSGVGGGTFMSDDRIKYHQFNHNVYPYTVEYEVELKFNHTFYFREWAPQSDEHLSVAYSTLKVITPSGYNLRFRNFNYPDQPQTSTDKGQATYTWEVKQLPALLNEFAAPEIYQRTTVVKLAPGEFEVQRYKGNMTTWQEFGKFIYTLNAQRDQLPDAIKQQVHQLTDGIPDTREKIKVLYQYMQKNTRYIGIQLGIGGWQTFDANYVATKGYGDCKALSNYMYSLLKEAGIRSHYTLVKAGRNEQTLIEDFSSNQFNHVIVCVPLGKDTTWLECTSQTLPAGYLSGFTAGRPVLLTSETGGTLARTPDYGMENNEQIRQMTVALDEKGDILLKAHTNYSGLQQDDLHENLQRLSQEKLLEALKKELNLPSYDVTAYACKEITKDIPMVLEDLEIRGTSYASVSGKRIFLAPNILNRSISSISVEEQRKSAISLHFPYRDIDSVTITVPAGYKAEAIPKAVILKCKFGSYTATTNVNGTTVTYLRKIERKAGLFPASDFGELVKFYDAISKADNSKVVLVKE